MSLRYALLALLNVEPMTGYDLYKEFETSVGHVWHAPDSQIYPELRRMESEGLLQGEEVPWGKRGKKRQYHVTEAGTEAFRSWMNTTMEYARIRDAAHLRAAYFEWAGQEEARAQMRAHIQHHESLLTQWHQKALEIEEGSSPMLNRRLAHSSDAEREKIIAYKAFAYDGLIAKAEAEIAWARRGLKLIDRLNS